MSTVIEKKNKNSKKLRIKKKKIRRNDGDQQKLRNIWDEKSDNLKTSGVKMFLRKQPCGQNDWAKGTA